MSWNLVHMKHIPHPQVLLKFQPQIYKSSFTCIYPKFLYNQKTQFGLLGVNWRARFYWEAALKSIRPSKNKGVKINIDENMTLCMMNKIVTLCINILKKFKTCRELFDFWLMYRSRENFFYNLNFFRLQSCLACQVITWARRIFLKLIYWKS